MSLIIKHLFNMLVLLQQIVIAKLAALDLIVD